MELVRIVIMTHSNHRYEPRGVNNNLRAQSRLTSSKTLTIHVITSTYTAWLDVRALQLDSLHIILNHPENTARYVLVATRLILIPFWITLMGEVNLPLRRSFSTFSLNHKFPKEYLKYSVTRRAVLLGNIKYNPEKDEYYTQKIFHPISFSSSVRTNVFSISYHTYQFFHFDDIWFRSFLNLT